jgi:mutual gliding-motility protein MglA
LVFFNYTTMQITAKIVYYGPGLCGKTTNLQHIHHKTASRSRGEMVSLETEADRTLFFDLLPLDVGVIGGMKVRLQLYTVPGQVFYNATRKLVLKGVDGVVFVADSQVAAREANAESLDNLHVNLSEQDLSVDQIPVVLQYNKRDIRNILSIDELNSTLNGNGLPYFEAAALHGIGVFETLKEVSRLTLSSIRKKLAEDARRQPALTAPLPSTPTVPTTPAKRPTAAPPPASANPLADLVPDVPAGEDPVVEFAEEDTDRHSVRPVKTQQMGDIKDELAKLRTLTGTPLPTRAKSSGVAEMDRRLQDVLVSVGDLATRQDFKRKAHLDLPGAWLKSSSAVRVLVEFEGDGEEERRSEVVSIPLRGNRKLERVTLRLDLDLTGKG